MSTKRTLMPLRVVLAACAGAVFLPAFAAAQSTQWAQTAGPEGAIFRTIAPTQNTLVAVIGGTGVSRLEGGVWKKVSDFTPAQIIPAGDILIGFKSGTVHSMEYYRSTDMGTTWHPVDLFSDFSVAVSVVGESIYATRNDTLFVSNDGLVTLNLLGPISQFSAPPVGRNDLLLRSGGFFSDTVFRSTDAGITWEPIETNLPPSGSGGRVLVGSGETFYATGSRSEVYRSSDGTTWEAINSGLPAEGFIDWLVANDQAAFLSINGGGIYYLDGTTWKMVDVPGYPFGPTLDGDRLLIPTNSGAYALSRDGSSLSSLSSGLRNLHISALEKVGNAVLAASTIGIYRTMDEGETWEQVLDLYASSFEAHGETVFTVAAGDILRTTDFGNTWASMQERFDDAKMQRWGTTEYPLPFSGITIADDGTLYVTLAESFSEHGVSGWRDGGVFRSEDNGETWQDVSNGLPRDGFSVVVPVGDAIALGDGVILISTLDGIFRSGSRGNGWSRMSAGLPTDDLQGLAGVFFRLNDHVYLRTAKGLFRTNSNASEGWQSVADIPLANQYWGGTGDHANIVDGRLYVPASEWDGTQVIPRTFAFDGNAWEDIGDEMPEGVPMNAFLQKGNRIFGGSQGYSVWSKAVQSSGVDESNRTAEGLHIAPNPVIGEFVVRVDAAEGGAEGRVALMNLLGETVAVMHEGKMHEGKNAYRFDMSDLPAGAYIVQVSVDGKRSEQLVIRQ